MLAPVLTGDGRPYPLLDAPARHAYRLGRLIANNRRAGFGVDTWVFENPFLAVKNKLALHPYELQHGSAKRIQAPYFVQLGLPALFDASRRRLISGRGPFHISIA